MNLLRSVRLPSPLTGLAIAASIGAPACDTPVEPGLDHHAAALSIGTLDPDDPGPTGPSLEPAGPAPKTHAELLAEAMEALGFTPSDPSTWSQAKRAEICQIWATEVARQAGTLLAVDPALQACLTGQPADLGMLAYQTLEMRRAGFVPTDPHGWSDAYRAEVCDVPFDQYSKSLLGAMTGALATKFAKGVFHWCDSYGAATYEYLIDWEPPSGWDYAAWEFANWRRHGTIVWGRPHRRRLRPRRPAEVTRAPAPPTPILALITPLTPPDSEGTPR